jgi:hypothetical protein
LASDAERACYAMRDHVTRVGIHAIENLSRRISAAKPKPKRMMERSLG